MFRNKGLWKLLVLTSAVSILATIAGFLHSVFTGILIFAITFLLTCIFIFFTYSRYLHIKKLSGYLRQISSGNTSLDVRDNEEGELSILKNEIYKMTLMLSESNSSLEMDKQKLTDAISDISHQLKTPLTSMMVMADLLSDDSLSMEKRKEFTHNIIVQLERLDWLVTSLLKLSKMDAGTVEFKKDKILVRNLIENVTKPLLIPMEIKNQSLELNGEAQTTFIGDFNWTTEALVNILKNCIEHTPENGKIGISYIENALYTEIIIQDNGVGIPKKDIPHIFKRFYKGKNASEGSIGIGLAMAHQIITNQNGDLEVSSAENEGTTFSIKFYKQVV